MGKKIYASIVLLIFLFNHGFINSQKINEINSETDKENVQNEETLIHFPGGKLKNRWLINQNPSKRFKILPYKPVYFLAANYTTDINNMPTSGNPLNTVTEASEFNNLELKFQLSFKTRALKKIFGNIGGDLWLAYTQTSRWQVYSAHISRPFRETNYEPEIMLIFPTEYKLFGLRGVFSGIGFTHQSNGMSNPLSRSWNRVILQFGLEITSWSIVLRKWWRIHEDSIEDNNPNIEDYVGRVELLTAYSSKEDDHNISILLRHSLRGGARSRGGFTFDYSYKIIDNLHINTQVFHGYGESLIDYNHKQTTVGIGVSLIQWR